MGTGYFAYIRVSIQQKQGQEGVSLPEQKAEIEQFASRQGLSVVRWFTETKTAASQGRPVFNEMLRLLRRGKADGVLIHKIDRSARNFRDWHDLGLLLDNGIDVRFCHENLDLRSRGGRLAADMMAVIATDYIRNLRDETLKGIRGRLRQGLFPTSAPLGYLDTGRGKAKVPDPEKAPLIRHAFQRYATATLTLHELRDELNEKGLRNRRGGLLSVNGVSTMLNNPFYIGLMRIKSWNEVFPGIHEPLIDVGLFEQVQSILKERAPKVAASHTMVFRRLMKCGQCGLKLIGERQKGHVYYRCHTRSCSTSVREEVIDGAVLRKLDGLPRTKLEMAPLEDALAKQEKHAEILARQAIAAAKARLGQIDKKLRGLADSWLDDLIDRETYEDLRRSLLTERLKHRERVATLERSVDDPSSDVAQFLERSKTAYLSYRSANPLKKRDLLILLTSNRTVSGKNVEIKLQAPFERLAEWRASLKGDPQQDTPRTLDGLIVELRRQPGQTNDITQVDEPQDFNMAA